MRVEAAGVDGVEGEDGRDIEEEKDRLIRLNEVVVAVKLLGDDLVKSLSAIVLTLRD